MPAACLTAKLKTAGYHIHLDKAREIYVLHGPKGWLDEDIDRVSLVRFARKHFEDAQAAAMKRRIAHLKTVVKPGTGKNRGHLVNGLGACVGENKEVWAAEHDKCIDCGRTDRPHEAGGRCNACYNNFRYHTQEAYRERSKQRAQARYYNNHEQMLAYEKERRQNPKRQADHKIASLKYAQKKAKWPAGTIVFLPGLRGVTEGAVDRTEKNIIVVKWSTGKESRYAGYIGRQIFKTRAEAEEKRKELLKERAAAKEKDLAAAAIKAARDQKLAELSAAADLIREAQRKRKEAAQKVKQEFAERKAREREERARRAEERRVEFNERAKTEKLARVSSAVRTVEQEHARVKRLADREAAARAKALEKNRIRSERAVTKSARASAGGRRDVRPAATRTADDKHEGGLGPAVPFLPAVRAREVPTFSEDPGVAAERARAALDRLPEWQLHDQAIVAATPVKKASVEELCGFVPPLRDDAGHSAEQIIQTLRGLVAGTPPELLASAWLSVERFQYLAATYGHHADRIRGLRPFEQQDYFAFLYKQLSAKPPSSAVKERVVHDTDLRRVS